MVVRPLVALMLAACLFAGCVADSPQPAQKSRDSQAGAVAALGGSSDEGVHASADASVGDGEGAASQVAHSAFQVVAQHSVHDSAPWYLAAVDIPEGQTALAGFRWVVPEGSVHEHKEYESFSGVSLEMAFLVPEGATIDEYTVSWFVIKDNTPELIMIQLGMPLEYTLKTTPLMSGSDEFELQLAPTFMVFSDRLVEDGTELGIVISAKGHAPAFGVAWRVLDFFAGYTDKEPAESSDEFLAGARNHGAGLSLQPKGIGAGFQLALYLDLNLQAMVGLELKAGPIEVTDDLPTDILRPMATVRDVTIHSSFENPHPGAGGWGFAFGAHLTALGTGTWSAMGDTHGTKVSHNGLEASLYSYSLFGAVGKEEPSSDLTYQLTIAGADYLEILEFMSVDYGTAISHLLGSDPATEGFGIGALAAEAPTVLGADLVLGQPMGPSVTLLGAGRLVQ